MRITITESEDTPFADFLTGCVAVLRGKTKYPAYPKTFVSVWQALYEG